MVRRYSWRHHAVFFELGLESGQVASLAGRSGHFDSEQAGFLQDFLEVRSGGAEIVVVLAIDDQDGNGGGEMGHDEAKGENPLQVHVGIVAIGMRIFEGKSPGWERGELVEPKRMRETFFHERC
jgi:hypothetical protein